jgi:hypothetical protein
MSVASLRRALINDLEALRQARGTSSAPRRILIIGGLPPTNPPEPASITVLNGFVIESSLPPQLPGCDTIFPSGTS